MLENIILKKTMLPCSKVLAIKEETIRSCLKFYNIPLIIQNA